MLARLLDLLEGVVILQVDMLEKMSCFPIYRRALPTNRVLEPFGDTSLLRKQTIVFSLLKKQIATTCLLRKQATCSQLGFPLVFFFAKW